MNFGKTYLIKTICALLTLGVVTISCSQTLGNGKMEIKSEYNFFDLYKTNLNGFNPGTGLTFKESVNVVTLSMKEDVLEYSKTGEIDIMSYYLNDLQIPLYKRSSAAEKDVLSLIWLTQLRIKSKIYLLSFV